MEAQSCGSGNRRYDARAGDMVGFKPVWPGSVRIAHIVITRSRGWMRLPLFRRKSTEPRRGRPVHSYELATIFDQVLRRARGRDIVCFLCHVDDGQLWTSAGLYSGINSSGRVVVSNGHAASPLWWSPKRERSTPIWGS